MATHEMLVGMAFAQYTHHRTDLAAPRGTRRSLAGTRIAPIRRPAWIARRRRDLVEVTS